MYTMELGGFLAAIIIAVLGLAITFVLVFKKPNKWFEKMAKPNMKLSFYHLFLSVLLLMLSASLSMHNHFLVNGQDYISTINFIYKFLLVLSGVNFLFASIRLIMYIHKN